jgi:hypothetical protein
VVIMLLCWATRDTKSAASSTPVAASTPTESNDPGKTRYVVMDSTSEQLMKPPIMGSALSEYPEAPSSRYDERKFMELPRGGLSCPNKRWYDAIYNGGAETILDAPDGCNAIPRGERRDVKSLWEEDAITRRRETRMPRMIVAEPHGMMV